MADDNSYQKLTQVFTNIASAINSKGVSGPMTAYEMPSKIMAIQSGSGESLAKSKSIAQLFSNTKAYQVGELVMYYGDLFRCISATTAGELSAQTGYWEENRATDTDIALMIDDNGHLTIKSTSTNQIEYVDMYRQNQNISVLLDATFNDVGYVNSGTSFVLPTAVSGHVRDFAMIMSLSGTSEIPSFTFPLVSSDLEPWSDPIPEWELSTTYRITFTETRNNKWEIHSASVKIT